MGVHSHAQELFQPAALSLQKILYPTVMLLTQISVNEWRFLKYRREAQFSHITTTNETA